MFGRTESSNRFTFENAHSFWKMQSENSQKLKKLLFIPDFSAVFSDVRQRFGQITYSFKNTLPAFKTSASK